MSQPGSLPRTGSIARIAMVDDHAAMNLGIATLLASCPDLSLVASAATVPELLTITDDIDLVILDLRLADSSTPRQNVAVLHGHGIEALAYTSGEVPTLVREAARAGVVGMIRKSEPPAALLEAIRAALAGEVVASTDWAAALDSDPHVRKVALTARETEVLALYASGAKANSVARMLGISRETVLDHIRRIRSKYTDAGRTAPTKIHLYQRAIEDGILNE